MTAFRAQHNPAYLFSENDVLRVLPGSEAG